MAIRNHSINFGGEHPHDCCFDTNISGGVRLNKRQGFIPLSSIEANGRCKNCGAELTGRRTSYCSDECAHEFLLKTSWQPLANKLKREANYTCQRCGKKCRSYCSEVADDRIEAHHIVPICEGGAEFDPDNVAIVCHECHMELHKRLEREKPEPAPELLSYFGMHQQTLEEVVNHG